MNADHQNPPPPAYLPSNGDAAIDMSEMGPSAKAASQPSPHMAMGKDAPLRLDIVFVLLGR